MKFNFFNLALIGLAITFVFTACDKDDDGDPTVPYEDVFGTWEWHSTVLGESGDTILVDSVDYEQTLEIAEAEKYTWKRGDSTLFESDFEIVQDTINSDDDAEYLFDFEVNTAEDQSFYIKNQDTLYLEDVCEDCDSHIFIRK